MDRPDVSTTIPDRGTRKTLSRAGHALGSLIADHDRQVCSQQHFSDFARVTNTKEIARLQQTFQAAMQQDKPARPNMGTLRLDGAEILGPDYRLVQVIGVIWLQRDDQSTVVQLNILVYTNT